MGLDFYIHLLLLKFITFNIILDVLARNRNYVMIILPRKADLEEDYDYDWKQFYSVCAFFTD